jgi:hypothetical protein
MLQAFRSFIGESQMMANLVMMVGPKIWIR